MGTTLLGFAMDRIRELAASHDLDRPRVAGAWVADTDAGAHALLKANGYLPARWFFHMKRDLSQPDRGSADAGGDRGAAGYPR